jgi:upstream activation factor subunit UAF30
MSSVKVKSVKVAEKKVVEEPKKVVAEKAEKAEKTEKKKAEKKAAEPASPEPAAPSPAPVVSEAPAPKEKKVRARKEASESAEPKESKKPVTNESVVDEVNQLVALLTESKSTDNLKQALKTVKVVASRLKHLRNDLGRLLKKTTRTKAHRDSSKVTNSGLSKPVMISKDLAQFMGVPADSLQSRVNVTNSICTYIKEQQLQNPENKREIKADEKLSRLLSYKASDQQPLTYFYIQQLIQPHFMKEVSSELADFMAVSHTSLQSSTSVAESLLKYCSSKGLVKEGVVSPDEKLAKLLRKSTDVSVKVMNQLVKVHFKNK